MISIRELVDRHRKAGDPLPSVRAIARLMAREGYGHEDIYFKLKQYISKEDARWVVFGKEKTGK